MATFENTGEAFDEAPRWRESITQDSAEKLTRIQMYPSRGFRVTVPKTFEQGEPMLSPLHLAFSFSSFLSRSVFKSDI